MTGFIPFSNVKKQYENLRDETLSTIDSVLSTGILLDGQHVKQLEENIKARTGRNHAIITHSGTVALEIIAKYYEGMPVTMPAISFPATANAFADGRTIRFRDVNNKGMMQATSCNNGVLLVVGLYGMPISPIDYEAKILVEDACQSWLAKRASDHTQVISFDPTKNLASMGNGGAIVTNDDMLAFFARAYINHGKTQDGFTMVGSNVRMSEIDCATLNMKMQYLDGWQERRRAIADYWSQWIEYPCMIDYDNIHKHGLQKFVIRVDARDMFVEKMKERGIECKVHYTTGLPDLPQMQKAEIIPPSSDYYKAILKTVVSLPFYPELTDDEVTHIAQSANECL